MTEPKKEPYLIEGMYGWFYMKKAQRRSINSVDLTIEQAKEVGALISECNKKCRPLKHKINMLSIALKRDIEKVKL